MKHFSIGYKKNLNAFVTLKAKIRENTVIKYILAAFVFIILFLTGCDNQPTLADLCKSNQKICQEFGEDSWCKSQKNAISHARITLQSNNTLPENVNTKSPRYSLLIAYEGYIKCMTLASQIQHIKLKEKTVLRTNNLLKAKAQLAELTEETAESNHPHILYYQWTRQSDEQALSKILALEGKEILENPTAQYHLATYYVKRDIKKTLGLLFHSLELHQQGTELEAEVLQTLATIFTNKEAYKQAYIWLKVYQLAQKESNKELGDSLVHYQQSYNLDAGFLDEVAENTLDNILAGKFISPKY